MLGLFSLVNRFAKLCYVLEKIRVFNFVEMIQVDKIRQISFVLQVICNFIPRHFQSGAYIFFSKVP